MIEPKSDGEIHTRPREFEQTFASQLCDKVNQPRIILKTNLRQKMQLLVVFSTGKVQHHKLFILLFIQPEICHSFQNLSVFTGWDIRVNQLFFKSGEGRCPVVPLVFKTSLGIVRSPEGSTPSLLRQETYFNRS